MGRDDLNAHGWRCYTQSAKACSERLDRQAFKARQTEGINGPYRCRSKIHFGKPCVAGTRVTVQDTHEVVDHDIPFDDIIRNNYPNLKVEDVYVCIR